MAASKPVSGRMTIWDDGQAPHVAAVQRFAVDQLTPITAYVRLRPLGAHTLLESVEGDAKIARYSFIALGEWARLLEAGGKAVLVGPEGTRIDNDPLHLLRWQSRQLQVAVPAEEALPFPGGVVGYFAYGWVRQLERIPERQPAPGPAWEWIWPKSVVAFDHRRQEVTVIVESRREDLPQAMTRLELLVEALRAPLSLSDPVLQVRADTLHSNVDAAGYREAVKQAQAYIRAGDIFQVVLSQAVEVEVQGDTLSLYRRLRRLNPSPYLFYLETPRRTLVGASPEALVRVSRGRVVSRPIAGTRPRGATRAEDEQLWDDLIHDEKERAEHVMLVDLARNDLGRVSRYGTVSVDAMMVRETYSHVMHIVSEISGQLAPAYDALDALAATFPAGTLTGAPKIRAMEIIDELEPEARRAYGGVVGYLSHRGDLDACITIRTIEVQNGRARVQAGAGIVADSEPDREYHESLNKARAALAVLEEADEEWL